MNDIKVLIVDDDPMVAEINKSFTEAVDGFRVVGIARNGREAIELIQDKQPDLMILDIYMPEADGHEVLASLRNSDVSLDVIMITAADDGATVSRVLRSGVVAYLVKPFKFERYRAALESYRNFRRKVLQKSTLGQADIDGLLVTRSENADSIPKNLHTQTLERVVDFLARQGDLRSAEDVAAGAGISRVTARRYLEYLVKQGMVQMTLDYLSVGRPIHRFAIKR